MVVYLATKKAVKKKRTSAFFKECVRHQVNWSSNRAPKFRTIDTLDTSRYPDGADSSHFLIDTVVLCLEIRF